MNNFITLPSGLRINTAHIILVRKHPDAERVIQISIVGGDKWMEEVISLEEWDALLQPQGTPIVSPILELRIPKVGEAVSFSYLDSIRHGVVSKITNGEPTFLVTISSSGETFQYWPDTGAVYLQSGDF